MLNFKGKFLRITLNNSYVRREEEGERKIACFVLVVEINYYSEVYIYIYHHNVIAVIVYLSSDRPKKLAAKTFRGKAPGSWPVARDYLS